ncbi:MAG: glycosyltransferase, partial [Elusimicrobia bacterium]|nr:glycosyltransferase [Elusimicrobiota bacterium]
MMERIRVLHVVETLDVGGAENVVVNIVNRLSDRFQPMICCLKKSGPVADRIRRAGVRVLEMGKEEGNDVRVPFRLAKILETHGIHVLHSHDWGTFCESALAGLIARTPAVVHMVHGLSDLYPAKDQARTVKKLIRRKVEKVLSIGVDRVIAVSDLIRDAVLRDMGVSPEKVLVIRNGVEFFPEEAGRSGLEERKREIGFQPGDWVLCSVGRLAAVKNYPSLIRGFAAVSARTGGRAKLVVLGDGPEREGLTKLIHEQNLAGRVFLLGERPDVRDWLALSRVFVLPSLYEGIPLAILEAMRAGLPVV